MVPAKKFLDYFQVISTFSKEIMFISNSRIK